MTIVVPIHHKGKITSPFTVASGLICLHPHFVAAFEPNLINRNLPKTPQKNIVVTCTKPLSHLEKTSDCLLAVSGTYRIAHPICKGSAWNFPELILGNEEPWNGKESLRKFFNSCDTSLFIKESPERSSVPLDMTVTEYEATTSEIRSPDTTSVVNEAIDCLILQQNSAEVIKRGKKHPVGDRNHSNHSVLSCTP